MLLPTIHIYITASMVAAYAAVLSTATASIQFANFFRDRVKVKVSVQHNMEMINDPRYEGATLTIMTVTNVGRRPVTITTVGALRLFPQKTHYVFPDVNPQLPRELTEGKYVQAIIKNAGLDIENISTWEAYSSTGKTFRFIQAPWYKRWPSDWKWKIHLKKQWKEKQTAKKTKP